ncbi:hypothetical protein VNO78_28054 [Psophocarpus tetragonolobus]|uniref:Uncharacterized protein n=1 Tax=Psophocarpus tetragonolobus TaxID=3891 RepID=A0AAN9S406_PSOTE
MEQEKEKSWTKARGGTCTIATCDPSEGVLHRALFLLENGFGGDHGGVDKQHRQAASCVAAVSAVVSSPLRFIASFGGLALVGCGMYCVSRYASDIGVRRDVTKVPVEKILEMVQED